MERRGKCVEGEIKERDFNERLKKEKWDCIQFFGLLHVYFSLETLTECMN